ADDRGMARLEAARRRRMDHDLAAGHALADVVVGVPLEIQVQAPDVPHAEALPRGAGEPQDDRVLAHPVVAVAPRDLPRKARADRAVEVPDLVAELPALEALDGGQRIAHHPLRELA